MTTHPVSGTDSSTTVQDLRTIVGQFVAERDWQKFHDIKNLSMSLAIEAAELMEHSQWLTTTQTQQPESLELAEVAEELADVLALRSWPSRPANGCIEHIATQDDRE